MSKPNKPLTSLNNPQKKFLKGIAHHLNPMIMVGGNGLTESVMAELEITLAHHELLKIKISAGDREQRKQIIQQIIDHTDALLVQTIGKTCVIFKQKAQDSEFSL